MNTIKRIARRSLFGFLVLILCAIRTDAQTTDSLDIKIGQMLLIGFPGPEVDAKVLEEVRTGKVGSIILFEKNIPPRNSFIALKKITWTYQQAAPIPLLIGIDQEGGRVNRLKEKYGFPRSITAAAMGRSHSLDTVRIYAEATAATLAGLGINVNFAPVVDLASNPDNPIIARYGRAFSADEDSVALLAREFIKAHRKYNVLTALKHFPGHGSSKSDTHLGIADVTNTWEPRELKPYTTLIDSGYVDAVMSAHIVNMKLDPSGNPGTLSKPILTGILRDSLHYDGVVFSDDMQMHAITEQYGLKDAIRLAIQAGIDIMTFSNNIAGSDKRTADTVHALIREMVKNGEIQERRIDESFHRIMKLKSRLTSHDDRAALMRELRAVRSSLERTTDMLQEISQKVKDQATPPEEKSTKTKRRK
ncbi:MAG TPA: glycoside hydrolase family 3 protein [Chryseosolibacter sp.]|nr:glycoside hydrolase family 3 protein [Chryseosolibacter sp.]